MVYVLIRIAFGGGSNEYSQHTIIWLNIKNTSLNYPRLSLGLTLLLTFSGWYYPCLENIFHGSEDVNTIEVNL